MPPMSFVGQVTKVGFMNKTATITIPRYIFHPKTGKVCPLHSFVPLDQCSYISTCAAARTEYEDPRARRKEWCVPPFCLSPFPPALSSAATAPVSLPPASLFLPASSHPLFARAPYERHRPDPSLSPALRAKALHARGSPTEPQARPRGPPRKPGRGGRPYAGDC